MRFIENGPAIPDELLLARDEGRVVFFCGAGVSRAKAGLDDFFGLADSVLNTLHVSAEHTTRKVLAEAKEIGGRTGASGLISADRVFGLLEREFLVNDIEAAVANALKPVKDTDLSAHRIMLDLATTAEGKLKLVTTNFDRLFEASLKQCGINKKILHPPHLPDLTRTGEFDGIIHLHGIVNENYDSAEGDGFILSSSEFGRAYLSEGWATEFFREILNQYAVVFIGYGAEDPPVQYLLEALNKKHGQLSEVYAFQDGVEHVAIGKWFHKGVEAIAFDASKDFQALWDTLDAWSKRARSPQSWYQEIIDLAKQGPEALNAFQRGQVAHVVSTAEGARKFCEGDELPPSEWLCVFDPNQRYTKPGNIWENHTPGELIDPFKFYCLDSDEVPQLIDSKDYNINREIPKAAWDAFTTNKYDRQNLQDDHFPAFRGHWSLNPARLPSRLYFLSLWLSKVADQPAAIWWAAKQLGLHPDIQHEIKREIFADSKAITPEIRQAWRYLFGAWSLSRTRYDQFSLDWHHLKNIIEQDGWTHQTLREFAELHRPFLNVKPSIWHKQKPPKYTKKFNISDVLSIEVEYPEQTHDIKIPDEWLEVSICALRQNLEHALQMECEINGFRPYSFGAILTDGDTNVDWDRRTTGIYGYVVYFSQQFERLAKLNIAIAQQEFSSWPENDLSIFDRLRVWATGLPGLVSEEAFASVLLGLSGEMFWDRYCQRDLLLTLSKRWSQLSEDSRLQLETRMLSGRPRWETETDQEYFERNAWLTLNRLHWLAEQGCHFSFNLEEETKRFQQHVPDWTPERSQSAIESMGKRGGFVHFNEEYSDLLNESLETILSKAEELSGKTEEFLIENAPYDGLCNAKPMRAFSALTHSAKRGEFPKWAWERFLYSSQRENDKPRLSALIAERVASYPAEELIEFVYPITQWLKKVAKSIAENFYDTFDRIIEKLITLIETQHSVMGSSIVRGNKPPEWIFEAINSPVGHITQILFSDPRLNQLEKGEKLPSKWVRQIERLLKLSDDLHRYAVVILARNLSWLYFWAPGWTEANLLSALTSENTADMQAFWTGFLWAQDVPNQPLYTLLKAGMLNLAKVGNLTRDDLERPLAGILLAGWGSIHEGTGERCVTNDEFHDVILNANDEFRCHVIWNLEQFCEESEAWNVQVPELFRDVWPKQKSVKTPRVSAALFDLVFSNTNHFNETAKLILPLLTTLKTTYFDSSSFEKILDQYPQQAFTLFYKVFAEQSSRDWPYNFEQALERVANADNSLRADSRWLEFKRKLR